jgi:membrane protein DedA with SNARE-associated domain/rhodanese-related sulfurtransferase
LLASAYGVRLPMTSVTQLSYWGLWAAVFARQLCLPVPALLFLMTAGALAAHGHLHLSLVLLAGVLGCLAGDGVWFWFGRHWGSRIVRLICRLSSDPRACSQKAQNVFDRWGLRILMVAKFVPGLDGVTPPMAGAEGATVLGFLAYDTIGAFLWSAAYVAIGYIFADQLDAAIRGAERFGSLLGAVIGIPLLAYVCWRGAIMLRMIGYLRLRRMSPARLYARLRAGDKIAVIDLLSFEDGDEDAEGIAGALRFDPVRLKAAPFVFVPEDLDVVLYCSSPREIISARIAISMRRRGIKDVWVLDGGLDAWRKLGLPLSKEFSTAEEMAGRLGILLPAELVSKR